MTERELDQRALHRQTAIRHVQEVTGEHLQVALRARPPNLQGSNRP